MPRGPKPLKSPLKNDEFYCLSCRNRRKSVDFSPRKIKNKKAVGKKIHMLSGTCSKCGTRVNKIISKAKYESL